MPALWRAALAATLALPPMLLAARGLADGLMSVVGVLFLVRSAVLQEWGWCRAAHARLALLLWAWLVLCSVAIGLGNSALQGALTIRFFLFALALEGWVLVPDVARRWLRWVVALTAAWIVLQCWQQYLTGTNIFGHPRWGDGALTGPFLHPQAAGPYLEMFFPAVLPPVMALAVRPDWRGRLAGVALLAAAAASMVLIGQRMPSLLMVLGLLISALLLRRLRVPVLIALAAGAVLLSLTPILSPPTFAKLVVRFGDQMSHFWQSSYGLLFMRAMAILNANPLMGLGFDGFRANCADPAYFRGVAWLGVADADSGGLAGCNIHPHNYYLEVATSAGWPGLLLFVALVVAWLRAVGRDLLPAAMPVRVALFVACAVSLWPIASTSALFGVDAAGWVFLMLGWGLAAAACRGSSGCPGRSPP